MCSFDLRWAKLLAIHDLSAVSGCYGPPERRTKGHTTGGSPTPSPRPPRITRGPAYAPACTTTPLDAHLAQGTLGPHITPAKPLHRPKLTPASPPQPPPPRAPNRTTPRTPGPARCHTRPRPKRAAEANHDHQTAAVLAHRSSKLGDQALPQSARRPQRLAVAGTKIPGGVGSGVTRVARARRRAFVMQCGPSAGRDTQRCGTRLVGASAEAPGWVGKTRGCEAAGEERRGPRAFTGSAGLGPVFLVRLDVDQLLQRVGCGLKPGRGATR